MAHKTLLECVITAVFWHLATSHNYGNYTVLFKNYLYYGPWIGGRVKTLTGATVLPGQV